MLLTKIRPKSFALLIRLKRIIDTQAALLISWIAAELTERKWLLDCLPKRRHVAHTILIVRLDLIGDFILWLAAAKELKRIYPASHLTLYANSTWSSLAARLPYWDEVVAVDVPRLRSNDLYRLKIFLGIHWQAFNIAIQPTFSREYVGDMVVRASAALQRIGYQGDLNNITKEKKDVTDAWYTQQVYTSVDAQTELQINEAMIQHLGDHDFKSDILDLPVLCQLPLDLVIRDPYVLIVPGASWQLRAWPATKFAELIFELSKILPHRFVLCGSSNEIGLCAKVTALCPAVRIINLAGQTSLVEMIELVRGAEFIVANESAAIHIAAATKTPSICIAGGGHFGRFVPYKASSTLVSAIPIVVAKQMDCFGCKWKCVFELSERETVPCISDIAVDEVRMAVERVEILAKYRDQKH